jgi:transcriptional regulator with XRE-family HTH domain
MEFVRERVRSSVALQIRAIREQRKGMTQKQLGEAIGKAQAWISVLEDPEYGKMSVATLLSLAEAFDTDLEIKFRSFSRALNELTKQGPDYFEVRSFADELPELERATTMGLPAPAGRWSDITRAANLLTPQEARGDTSLDVHVPSASGAMQYDVPEQGSGSFARKIVQSDGERIIHLVNPINSSCVGRSRKSRKHYPGRRRIS